jgi:hypothetical protein
MSDADDLYGDMHRFDRDDELVDRMLDGRVLAEDVPPGLAEVAALFEQATSEPTEAELSAQDRVVAAMATVLPDAPSVLEPRRNPVVHRLVKAKVATAVVVAGLGVGAAAAAVSTVASPSRPQSQAGAPTTIAQVTMPPTSAPQTSTAATAAPATSNTPTARNAPTTTSGTVAANAARSGKASTTTAGAAPARGPDALGPAAFGLCTAWHGGRETGNKLNAPPFVNLANAAATFGKSIDDFCAQVFATHDAAGNDDNQGDQRESDDHGQSGEDHGQSDDAQGKSDEQHGNSDEEHGKSGDAQGNGGGSDG